MSSDACQRRRQARRSEPIPLGPVDRAGSEFQAGAPGPADLERDVFFGQVLSAAGSGTPAAPGAAAAHASAIAGCNAKKKSGSKSCVVIAEFLPKDYKGPGVFSMSYTANEYFAKEFRRAKAPKAFAISPSAGSWGSADGAASTEAAQAAALADCSAKAAKVGAKDCRLVSAD